MSKREIIIRLGEGTYLHCAQTQNGDLCQDVHKYSKTPYVKNSQKKKKKQQPQRGLGTETPLLINERMYLSISSDMTVGSRLPGPSNTQESVTPKHLTYSISMPIFAILTTLAQHKSIFN